MRLTFLLIYSPIQIIASGPLKSLSSRIISLLVKSTSTTLFSLVTPIRACFPSGAIKIGSVPAPKCKVFSILWVTTSMKNKLPSLPSVPKIYFPSGVNLTRAALAFPVTMLSTFVWLFKSTIAISPPHPTYTFVPSSVMSMPSGPRPTLTKVSFHAPANRGLSPLNLKMEIVPEPLFVATSVFPSLEYPQIHPTYFLLRCYIDQ